MLRGLAEAGADVMMHGLVTADEAKTKTSEIASEFGVQCRHSAADVTKPAEIRYHSPTSNGTATDWARLSHKCCLGHKTPADHFHSSI